MIFSSRPFIAVVPKLPALNPEKLFSFNSYGVVQAPNFRVGGSGLGNRCLEFRGFWASGLGVSGFLARRGV